MNQSSIYLATECKVPKHTVTFITDKKCDVTTISLNDTNRFTAYSIAMLIETLSVWENEINDLPVVHLQLFIM